MTLTNMRNNSILIFALLSMPLWSAAATLRKPSQNLSDNVNALQKRLAEEDDITNLLLSDECF